MSKEKKKMSWSEFRIWKNCKKYHKKADWGDSMYNKVQDLLFELFEPSEIFVDLENCRINVCIGAASFMLVFSYNETKIYVYGYVDPQLRELDMGTQKIGSNAHELMREFIEAQGYFRVFSYESIEEYIRLKKQERDLIEQIYVW